MAEITFYSATFLLTFLATAGLSAAAWTLVFHDPLKVDAVAAPTAAKAETARILRSERLSTLSVYNLLLSRLRVTGLLKTLLLQANVNWSVGRASALMLLGGVITLNVLLQLDLLPLWGSLLAAAAGAAVPILYLRKKRASRYREIEDQLPEALDYLSRATIAGHSLPMSMELVADEVGPPLSTELRKTVDEYNLGSSMDDSLKNLAARLPMVDVQFFVSAILTQSKTGGNLHDLLDNLSETIRERSSLKGQVRALTANGRLTAVILTLLPCLVAAVMWMVNGDYFGILFTHPAGKTLVFLAVCAQVVAYFVINRIVDIKV